MTIDLEEAKRQLELIKKAHQDQAGQLMRDMVQEVFDMFPELENFSWTQYAPTFNDGEACIFHAHFDSYELPLNLKLDEDGEYEEEYEDDKYDEEGNRVDEPDWYKAARKEIAKRMEILTSGDYDVPDTFFIDMFGSSPARIIMTREGYKVQEYYVEY